MQGLKGSLLLQHLVKTYSSEPLSQPWETWPLSLDSIDFPVIQKLRVEGLAGRGPPQSYLVPSILTGQPHTIPVVKPFKGLLVVIARALKTLPLSRVSVQVALEQHSHTNPFSRALWRQAEYAWSSRTSLLTPNILFYHFWFSLVDFKGFKERKVCFC